MAQNVYDQACRYLAKLEPADFLCWLLGLPPDALLFRRRPDRFHDSAERAVGMLCARAG